MVLMYRWIDLNNVQVGALGSPAEVSEPRQKSETSCQPFSNTVAVFQSLQDGNGAAMAAALNQLQEVLKH